MKSNMNNRLSINLLFLCGFVGSILVVQEASETPTIPLEINECSQANSERVDLAATLRCVNTSATPFVAAETVDVDIVIRLVFSDDFLNKKSLHKKGLKIRSPKIVYFRLACFCSSKGVFLCKIYRCFRLAVEMDSLIANFSVYINVTVLSG